MSAHLTPAGSQTYSKAPDRYPPGAPRLALHARGPCVWCEGARPGTQERYVDYVSAMGAVILGHRHPAVDFAVTQQLQDGVSFSLPTRLEYALAERLCALVPGAEMVRFAKNGNDATNAAVRLARAVTGRVAVVMVEDGYHGHADTFMGRPPMNGGVLRAVQGSVRYVERHDLAAMETMLREYPTAAVIMEPVLATDPQLPPPGYLEGVRKLCDEYGALLVFDEVVTGFRAGIPGYPTDVRADLYCYGKALANGFPLSALVGPRETMQRIERDVFFSTTFGGEALSLAAALATLEVMEAENVPDVLARRGRALMAGFNAAAEQHGVDAAAYGYPQRPVLRFREPAERAAFLAGMVKRRILTQGYFNLTLAHDDRCIAETVDAFGAALAEARQAAAASVVA